MVARETGSHGTKQKSAHKELPVTALLEAGVATWPHGTQWISPRSVPQIKECCAITTCNCPCPEKPCQLFGFIPIPSFFKTQHPRRELFLLFTPCLPWTCLACNYETSWHDAQKEFWAVFLRFVPTLLRDQSVNTCGEKQRVFFTWIPRWLGRGRWFSWERWGGLNLIFRRHWSVENSCHKTLAT